LMAEQPDAVLDQLFQFATAAAISALQSAPSVAPVAVGD